MDKYHENKISTLKSIDGYFIERPAEVQLVPAMTRKVGVFHTTYVLIKTKDAELQAVTSGKTKEKVAAQDALLNILFRFMGNLRSVARDTKNVKMLESLRVSDSAVLVKRDTEKEAFAESVYKYAVDNSAALKDHNVDDAMIAEFRSCIDDFGVKTGASHAAPSEHSEALTELYKLIASNRRDACRHRRLDGVIPGFEAGVLRRVFPVEADKESRDQAQEAAAEAAAREEVGRFR